MRDAIADAGASRCTARSTRPKGHKGPRPPLPQPTGAAARALPAARPRSCRLSRQDDQPARRRRIAAGALRRRADPHRRRRRSQRNYIARAPRPVPRRHRRRRSTSAATPTRTLAAQLLGTIGQITKTQLSRRALTRASQHGTDIGQNGLESEYDSYLRGTRRLATASRSTRPASAASARHARREPKPGRELKLTLRPRPPAGRREGAAQTSAATASPGAFVAHEPAQTARSTRWARARASTRATLDGPFSTKAAYEAKFGNAAGSPLFNRATRRLSDRLDFKPITALAALGAGVITPGTTIFNDTGCFQTGARADIDVPATPAARPTGRSTWSTRCRSPPTSTSTTWAWSCTTSGRPAAAELGARARARAPHRHRPARRGHRHDARARRGSREHRRPPSASAASASATAAAAASPTCGAVEPGRQDQLRRRPGRPAGHAAADGDRLLDDHQRRPRAAPHLGAARSRTTAGCVAADRPAVQAQGRRSRPRGARRSWRACTRPPTRTAARPSRSWTRAGRATASRSSARPARAEREGQADQSWYVAYSYDRTPERKPIVVVVHGRAAAASAPRPPRPPRA